jgi:membrane-associated PAP2 superfamily phosphatase
VWRFYTLHAGIPAAIAVVVLGVFESTNLDRRIEDLFYDPVAGRFPHRVRWLLETVFHDFGRLSVIALGVGLFAAFLLSWRRPALLPWRRALLYGVLCLVICPVTIAQIKQNTVIHCPRKLDIYGGSAPYVRLFDAVPAGLDPGHCWPGGHSSGGFAMMSLYFVFRRRKPRIARLWLIGGFTYGFVLGFGRVVQGSHFVSHNLWAALFCWSISLALYELMLRRYESEVAGSVSGEAWTMISAPSGAGGR